MPLVAGSCLYTYCASKYVLSIGLEVWSRGVAIVALGICCVVEYVDLKTFLRQRACMDPCSARMSRLSAPQKARGRCEANKLSSDCCWIARGHNTYYRARLCPCYGTATIRGIHPTYDPIHEVSGSTSLMEFGTQTPQLLLLHVVLWASRPEPTRF